MSNPFFAALGGGRNNGFAKMIEQLNQFRANFSGDPKAEVDKLLQSGRMSQEQLNQLQAIAKQIVGLMQ